VTWVGGAVQVGERAEFELYEYFGRVSECCPLLAYAQTLSTNHAMESFRKVASVVTFMYVNPSIDYQSKKNHVIRHR
jgi:hypothetical protein